jgi:hypothetical protein
MRIYVLAEFALLGEFVLLVYLQGVLFREGVAPVEMLRTYSVEKMVVTSMGCHHLRIGELSSTTSGRCKETLVVTGAACDPESLQLENRAQSALTWVSAVIIVGCLFV